jgi:electron transfer flavoprotein beta subunit
MKILVCISVTPDTTSRIIFKNNNTEFNTDGVQYILNPYDEWYALVRGLEIKEKSGGTVTVIHVGPAQNDAMVRKALAIGADDAIRINLQPGSSYETAKQIFEAIKGQGFDLILLGKETIDFQDGELGAMLSELLDLPFVSFASKLETDGSKLTVQRDIEGGIELLEVQLPAIISAAKGMAEQRIPNMKGIMSAKSKPFQIIEPVAMESPVKTIGYTLPPPKQGVKMIAPEDMDELVRLLHEEAKVF